jgi:predicted MFS family arabinose efflux permease
MKKLIQIYIKSYSGLSPAAWLLALVMLINRMGSMVIPFLGMYMTKQLGFDISHVGVVLACYGCGSVAGSWLGGWLTDKVGNFKVQSTSLILTAPLFLIMPLFTTFESMAAMVFVLSLVADTFRPANSVSVARYAKPENLTKAYSLNRMAVNLGFSVGPALGGFLATFSYNWIFYGNAIAVAAAAIVFFYFFYNRKGNTISKEVKVDTRPVEKDRNPYKDRPFILFSVLCCLFSMAFFQLISTLPLFYQDVHKMTEGEIGLILGFSGFVIVVFEMLLVHIVEHRATITRILFYGTLFAGLSYFMLNFNFGVVWLYMAMFMLSLGEMLTLPFMATVTALRSTRNTQGAYMGMNSIAFAFSNIFGPFLGTKAVALWGYHTLWYIDAAILVVVAFGFIWSMKKLNIN